ncbi:MAG: DNA-binding protein [Firmicutes bacterium]|nr:DNA-binding protein [Bacillota bacterium]
MAKDLITAQALADTLDLSVETIWRYTRTKRIPYVELGSRQYRYNLEAVVAALAGTAVGEESGDYRTTPSRPAAQQGGRYELLAGKSVLTPAPSILHQRVARELQYLLITYFRQIDPQGEVFSAPLDVALADDTIVCPDIIYVAGPQRDILKDTKVEGAPTLIAEVMSRDSRRRDRIDKMEIYKQAEVQHYWLLDPIEKILECFVYDKGYYSRPAAGMEAEVVEHPDFAGLNIPLANLWWE